MRPTRRRALAGGLALAAAPAIAQPAAFPPLTQAAARSGRLFGCAVEPHRLDADPAFAALVARHCGVLVPENAMKWNALRPAPETFDFGAADRLAAQAKAMGARIHGHCLLWHEALPAWLPNDPSRREAERLLRDHIARVVSRYRGRVASWDVVNEAVERNDRRPDGLRISPWLRALGPDYLAMAFETAHAADPAARLTLSDYGLEYDDVSWMVEKRGTMLDLLRRLKRDGRPIHAVGLQAHLLGERPAAFGQPLATFLRQVADLGLEIYVTELDVKDQALEGDPARRDAVVADTYRRFLDVVLREPAVRMINTWGLSDRYSATADFFPRADGSKGRPMPFDADLKPKLAAHALLTVFSD